jgi:photosystem II stability/assembly factor-like uncharacterized protein
MIRSLALIALSLLLAVTPQQAQATTLFGLIDTGELFASSDTGETWQVRSALPVSDAVGLAAGQTSSELFLISRTGTIYYSTDAGMNWDAVGAVTSSDVIGFTLQADGTVLVLTETGSLFASVDNGASFTTLAALTASNFVSLTPGSSAGSLYALTATGEVMESLDDGAAWITKGAMPVSDAVEIQGHGGLLYVITGTGLTYCSSDAAASWTAIGTLSQVHVSGMTSDGFNLIATVEEGEVATSHDGTSWTWRGAINQLSVMALATDIPGVIGVDNQPPALNLSLSTPWPNPRSGAGITTFRFTLPAAGRVSLSLYDVRGARIARSPAQDYPAAGRHSYTWDPGVLDPGVYLVRLETDSGPSTTTKWVTLR